MLVLGFIARMYKKNNVFSISKSIMMIVCHELTYWMHRSPMHIKGSNISVFVILYEVLNMHFFQSVFFTHPSALNIWTILFINKGSQRDRAFAESSIPEPGAVASLVSDA